MGTYFSSWSGALKGLVPVIPLCPLRPMRFTNR